MLLVCTCFCKDCFAFQCRVSVFGREKQEKNECKVHTQETTSWPLRWRSEVRILTYFPTGTLKCTLQRAPLAKKKKTKTFFLIWQKQKGNKDGNCWLRLWYSMKFRWNENQKTESRDAGWNHLERPSLVLVLPWRPNEQMLSFCDY